MKEEMGVMELNSYPVDFNCCALIVLYYPDKDFLNNLECIKKQFPLVILVDNTPGGAEIVSLKKIILVGNQENYGIAKALNQGIKIALEHNYDWVATFDQDTKIFEKYFETMSEIAKGYSGKPLILGCNYITSESGEIAHNYINNKSCAVKKNTLITSGTFLPLQFSNAIGGFREDYFIDSVDHEFCLRAKKNGAEVLLVKKALMSHAIGKVPARVCGVRLSFQHPAFRRYYISRNTILTIKQNILSYPFWCFKQIGRLFFEFVSILILENDKSDKMLAFLKGLIDGVKFK